MEVVYVLHHVHKLETLDSGENIVLIGVYSSELYAREAVERLKNQPGFKDHSRIIEPLIDDEESGFFH